MRIVNRLFSTSFIQTRLFSTSGLLRSSTNPMHYETLTLTSPSKGVFHVQLNRPEVRNALKVKSFEEILQCFKSLSVNTECRAVVLSGAGKMFCSGLDLTAAQQLISHEADLDPARKGLKNAEFLLFLQDSTLSVGRCTKPVIAAIHGGCIGAGLDLASAADIRFISKDGYCSIKEVDLGLAADLGSLQHLTKILGNDSILRELAYTGRKLEAKEAKEIGLVGRICDDQESVVKAALETAEIIAKKTPIAVRGIKASLNFSRDHSIEDGVQFIRNWNMSMLQTDDLMRCAMSLATKSEPPEFDDA